VRSTFEDLVETVTSPIRSSAVTHATVVTCPNLSVAMIMTQLLSATPRCLVSQRLTYNTKRSCL